MTIKDPATQPPRARGTPIYERVEADLLDRVASGLYAAGSMLPTEQELCEAYGCSRITLRRAMDGLVARGLVVRTAGRGTMVCSPDEMVKSIALTGYIDDAIPLNRHRVIDDTMQIPPSEIAALLHMPAGVAARCIRSVNHSGELPLSYSHFFYPPGTAHLISPEDFLGSVPPVRVIEQRSGLPVASAEQVVDPVIATPEVASLLGVDPGRPVLRAIRGYFSAQREPLEAVFVYYHPERYRYQVTLIPKVLPVQRKRGAV